MAALPASAGPLPLGSFSAPQFLQALARRVDRHSLGELERVLTADFPERPRLDEDGIVQQRRMERILERAWAAELIGQLGTASDRAIQLLEQTVASRTLHRDWAYQGLDGVMAVRALGALRTLQSVPMLVNTFWTVSPELKRMLQGPSTYPYGWADFRVKSEIIATLGQLPGTPSKSFLLNYVAMDASTASKFSPPLFEDATQALLQQSLTRAELQQLLQSTNLAVRGTAVLECLGHPTPTRTACLQAVLPWTRELPEARPPLSLRGE